MRIHVTEEARQMMHPSAHVVRSYAMPRAVVAEACTRSPEHRAFVMDSLAGVRALCRELGLVTGWTRPLWRRLGIADAVEVLLVHGGDAAR